MNNHYTNRRAFLKMAGAAGLGFLSGCGCNCPFKKFENPSVDLMIGQMIMAGFRGLIVNDDHPIVEDIKKRELGGVILFDKDVPMGLDVRNVSSDVQLKRLTDELQEHAFIPLLIAIDQEGGRIARLKPNRGFAATKSHSELGQLSPERTYEEAKIIAKTLKDAGINMNMAPVVDLCVNANNPVIAKLGRCFSDDPDVVAAHAMAYIKAHHEYGIRCCLKHYPGHGSSTADSHLGMVDVTNTWSARELEPYEKIIKADLADAIMTAHVFNDKIDRGRPATLSATAIQEMLRGGLKYNGVVFSDDMQMGAIEQYYGFGKAIEMAILAGVDVLVFANNSSYDPDIVKKAKSVIRLMLAEGKINEDRLWQSYERIMELKIHRQY